MKRPKFPAKNASQHLCACLGWGRSAGLRAGWGGGGVIVGIIAATCFNNIIPRSLAYRLSLCRANKKRDISRSRIMKQLIDSPQGNRAAMIAWSLTHSARVRTILAQDDYFW